MDKLARILLLLLICSIFLKTSTHAALFENEDCLKESQKKAKTLKEHIPTGRIVVTNSDESIVYDYASATVIGKPKADNSCTVLSCAHTYNAWNTPGKKFYFLDDQDQRHEILKVKSRTNKILDTANDLAIYYLKDLTRCNPQLTISKEIAEEGVFSSLSYGWTLAANNPSSLCNINPVVPYYLENTLHFYENLYSTEYNAVQIFNIEERHRITHSYIANFTPHKPYQAQFFLHDSGSAWFSGQEKEGYALAALSSQMAKVEPSDIESATTDDIVTKLTIDRDYEYTIQYFHMRESQTFWNFYTPLAPHWAWIQDRI